MRKMNRKKEGRRKMKEERRKERIVEREGKRRR